MNDILQAEGINSKGFGVLPKMVMQDDRLSIFAKAIYGYFCSYAGAGKQAFPRVAKIVKDLGISRNAYYKHFNQLRDCGYVKADQKRISGKLSHNIYTLMQTVEQPASPCTTSWDTMTRDTTAWDTMKRDAYKSNSIEKEHSLKSNSQSRQSAQAGQGRQDERNITQEIETYTALIQDNIGYEDFREAQPFDMALVDEIVSVIVDVLVSDSSHVRVDGEDKPRELVRSVFMKLSYAEVDHVVGQFKGLTERVRKKRQYFITMLYNSRHELDAHYTNEVRSDLGGRP